jgi:hypothetical protein
MSWAPVAGTCNPNYWEAEKGRIEVGGQPRQGVCKTPYQPIAGCSGACLSSQATVGG